MRESLPMVGDGKKKDFDLDSLWEIKKRFGGKTDDPKLVYVNGFETFSYLIDYLMATSLGFGE
jgi:hypothetical protein